MSDLTLTQALAELRSLSNPTIAQLRDIVSRTSAGQTYLSIPKFLRSSWRSVI